MSSAQQPEEATSKERSAIEEHSFDGLAKGIASGAIPRGRALKLAGAAILGSALGAFSLSENAQARTKKCRATSFVDPRCSGVSCSTGCTGSNCSCIQTTENNFVCVEKFCPSSPTSCTTSTQCSGGQVCMSSDCCHGSGNVCATLCGSTPTPFASSMSKEGSSSENKWGAS